MRKCLQINREGREEREARGHGNRATGTAALDSSRGAVQSDLLSPFGPGNPRGRGKWGVLFGVYVHLCGTTPSLLENTRRRKKKSGTRAGSRRARGWQRCHPRYDAGEPERARGELERKVGSILSGAHTHTPRPEKLKEARARHRSHTTACENDRDSRCEVEKRDKGEHAQESARARMGALSKRCRRERG
jgi:hypothetical protein